MSYLKSVLQDALQTFFQNVLFSTRPDVFQTAMQDVFWICKSDIFKASCKDPFKGVFYHCLQNYLAKMSKKMPLQNVLYTTI